MGSVLNFTRDTLTNLVSMLGTSRDKAASTHYGVPVLTEAEILNAYRGAWLPRKIVDIPALDSCREWRAWQADDSAIELIEGEEKRLNVRGKVLEARIKARLWGGAAVYIGTGDSDPRQPLEVERIGKAGIKFLTVLSRRQLNPGEIETNPESEWYDRPKLYTLANGGTPIDIHPSRLVIFLGNPDPDPANSGQRGWADSVLISVTDAIKQADGTAANIASLVFEAKINIIRIPNFMASVGDPGYRSKLLERYTLAATSKGINGDLILDKEEEFEQRTSSFAQLPDVLDRFLQIVSGAADIPATRLLGQSPAGMNATGESDLRNYYDRISAGQEIEMTPAMHRLDEAIIRSATGGRDEAIYYDWKPLWQLSDKERADIFKTKADGARLLAGTGTSPALLPIDALSDALVNTLIEDNSLPGLEAAIDEYGKLSEQEEDPEEVEAAALAPKAANANEPTDRRKLTVAKDAAPRTLYVSRKVTNAAAIIRWAKSQGFETTLEASDLHVTIAFSRKPVDWFAVGESWSSEIKISAGGPRQMEQFGEATVLLFNASELRWRHDEIERAGASWDHPEYQPHITISYSFEGDLSKVQPYQGEIVLGPELFAEVKEDWAEGITET
jgi:phage-related protein (TIGR01555 family)